MNDLDRRRHVAEGDDPQIEVGRRSDLPQGDAGKDRQAADHPSDASGPRLDYDGHRFTGSQ
ncbi:hypothetical protein ACVW0I_001889 [Bradyrhizobium sp. LM6.11]